MIKNWSKIVLVSMLVIAIAAPAFATTARVRSLANTGDYLSDDSNVFRWYSTLPSYANMVQAEIGTWNDGWIYSGSDGELFNSRALGFNYACGEDGKWGTYRVSLLENAVHSVTDKEFFLMRLYVNIAGSALDRFMQQFIHKLHNRHPCGFRLELLVIDFLVNNLDIFFLFGFFCF